jgi:secreted PhoX family phosphatase
MSKHLDDLNCNTSANEHFSDVLERSLQQPTRRGFLRGTVGIGAVAALPALSACGGSDDAAPAPSLTFNAVEKSLDDIVKVPAGYVVQVVHATGDPLDTSLDAYSNLGSETDDWSRRIGDHHDGMDLFYVDMNGKYSEADTGRALLAVNHESSADAHFFHPKGQTSGGVNGKKFTQFGDWDLLARPADGLEVLKEINHHGVSIVELSKTGTTWSYKKDSAFNRRVTGQTPVSIAGPAAHLSDIQALMVTAYDTTGAMARGTLNNCGHGKTPWGTYLGCEENWAVYFGMPAGSTVPDAKMVAARARYGVVRAPQTGAAGGSQGWHTVGNESQYARWNAAASGVSAANDYRNEPHTFGYNVEIDPLVPTSTPAKRIAMGRFAHEAAVNSLPVAGKPLAFYMGCDSRNEYIYKFVTAANWSASDVGGGMTAGNKYLNEGKLYAAKFNADGTGQWLLLDITVDAIKNFSKDGFTFANQAEVLVFSRFAADAVGATKMDRPEWGAVNPANGEIYFALTNNNSTNRKPSTTDAANPRSYNDPDGNKGSGNPNGHIIRFRETNNESTALGFRWDIFLFGAEEDSAASVNLSGLTAANSFSSPDGLWFSKSTGICWIQTDDGAFTDETNCMLLAAIPGSVGDGKEITVANSLTGATPATGSQKTFIGAALGESRLRRFLVAPKGAEVTGITETPDGKTIFVNIQHPGENTKAIGTGSGFVFESSWPGAASGSQKYGPNTGRPRSATLAISRADGGKVGL